MSDHGTVDPEAMANAKDVSRIARTRTVRVGFARIGAWESRRDSLARTLDDRESARVARMRFERDRVALTVAYGLHREMLADELGTTPRQVALYRDSAGRPRVAHDPVWTSLSHAADWVAIAIDRIAPVGVDVESVERVAAVAEVAAAVLHPDEHQWAARHGRGDGALVAWVRKEAALKAAGVGLHVPMSAFSAAQPDAVRVPGIEGTWHVHDLPVDAAACAAVATRGRARVACSVMEPSRCPNAAIAFASGS